jgi:hypothetical protein
MNGVILLLACIAVVLTAGVVSLSTIAYYLREIESAIRALEAK